jgi:hypothetical protein
MTSEIEQLVSMRDRETLYELMNESDDEILQMDAAEALIRLDDKRGLEFLLIAADSDVEDISEVAKEILADPDAQRMRREIDDDRQRLHRLKVDKARERLQKGKKVYTYMVIYIPSEDILREDVLEEGVNIPDLDDAGLEGWEVVNLLPGRRVTGAYLLLKKEISPDEITVLDEA